MVSNKFLLVIILFSTNCFAQSNEPISVYLESFKTIEMFFKQGDTISLQGSMYGKDSIDNAIFILKDQLGSYKEVIKYKFMNKPLDNCFKGAPNKFGQTEIPIYNTQGEITGYKKRKYWKPVKVGRCVTK